MRVVVLGTTGYHPNERRHTSCVMLPALGVVLDAGTALFRIRRHIEGSGLEIFLSHAHLDHVIGLTYLAGILRGTGVDRVVIRGEEEKLIAVQEHLFSELLFPASIPADFVPLGTGKMPLRDGGQVTCFPLANHPGGSVGYRIDHEGSSLAYITDTTTCEKPDYLEVIQGVDLLIHECNFRDGFEEFASNSGHSCTAQVAALAARAGVGRLLMTHFNALDESDDPVGLEAARSIFPSTDIAEDGMELVIS